MDSEMDIIQSQLTDLLGDYKGNNNTENTKRLKNKLKWNKYVSQDENITPNNSSLHNPVLDIFTEKLEWEDGGWVHESNQNLLIQYPEYIPSNEAIKYLRDSGDILEIGAGDGYWSHVINQNGGNSIATDIYSPIQENDINVNSYPVSITLNNCKETVWENIQEDKHTIISDYPNHDILFCHPEGLSWTEEVLDLIKPSQKLILISSWYPGPNATPLFFKKLIDNWTLQNQIPIHTWNTSHASMYVFKKN